MRLNAATATSQRRFTTHGDALGRDGEVAGYSIAGHALTRPTRPSTIIRIERFRALISELATRDMELVAMADFLQCSLSGTRNYVAELVVATVLIAPDVEPNEAGCRNKQYRLSSDLKKVHRFLAGLAAPQKAGDGVTQFDRRPHRSLADARYLHVLTAGAASIHEAAELRARRDPLVEALFGEASSASDCKPPVCSQSALNMLRRIKDVE